MSSELLLHITTLYSVYHAYIILSLGILGNIITFLVFTGLKLFRGNRSAFFLSIESIANILYALVSLSLTILTSIYGDDRTDSSDTWCKIKFMLAQVFLLITYFMICCAAADQFFSTSYFFERQHCCTMRVAQIAAFTMICIWTVHSIIFALFFQVKPLVGCVIGNPIAVEYGSFFFYPVLAGFMPILTAVVFSLLAYRNVRRIVRRQIPIARRRLDRQMTAMVFVRVLCFLCLIFPYNFSRIYAINNPIPITQPYSYAVSQLVQIVFLSFVRINSAVISIF